MHCEVDLPASMRADGAAMLVHPELAVMGAGAATGVCAAEEEVTTIFQVCAGKHCRVDRSEKHACSPMR